MKFTQTLVALAIAAAATTAPTAFAQSADLPITGKIIPGACTVTMGNGGIADLGDINVRDLNADEVTDLNPITLPVSVACDAEVRYAFQGVDNSADTSPFQGRYGLGLTSAEEKIGGVELNILDTSADDVPGYSTMSSDGGETWSVSGNDGVQSIGMTTMRGINKIEGDSNGPSAIQVLQGNLYVKARIQPTSQLTIDGDVPLNGSVTLNLVYL